MILRSQRPILGSSGINELLRSQALPLSWFLFVGGLVGLPLLVVIPNYSYRYGLQWLGFYFACGGCSALVLAQSHLRRNYFRFLRDSFPSEAVAILLMMIAVSVCANGFVSQATGSLTMLMVLGVFPLLSFLWFIQHQRLIHLYLLAMIVVGVLLAESLFLSCYQLLGLSMSSDDSLSVWPRIFLNVRDGNQWLACGFWIPMSLWFSAHVPKKHFPLLFPRLGAPSVVGLLALFWYLDMLTYGRGAFLSMLLSTVCASFWCYQSLGRKVMLWFFRDQLIGFGLALMGVFALRSSLPFSNMATRLVRDVGGTDSNRWRILLHWLDSWLNTSVFWGHGWGVIPEDVAWAWLKIRTIYVQIVVDGGLCGVGLIMLSMIIFLRSIEFPHISLPSIVFCSGLFVYQGVDRIWAIPSGLTLVTASASMLFSLGCKGAVDASIFNENLRRLSAWFLYSLAMCLPLLVFMLIYFSDGRP